MTVRAVLFDIGNVLIGWHPDDIYNRAIGAQRRAEFFAAVPIMEMNERIDLGADFHASLTELAAQYPDWVEEIEIWRTRWIDMVCPVIDHSVRLLRALRRAGHPVFALSNFGADTFEMAEKEYPFLEEFDRRYISGQMRVIKPDPDIYRQVEDDCNIPPEALLFVDDRPENIEAAAARGWQTHLFDQPDAWAVRLVAEGLLTEEAAK